MPGFWRRFTEVSHVSVYRAVSPGIGIGSVSPVTLCSRHRGAAVLVYRLASASVVQTRGSRHCPQCCRHRSR